MQPVVCLLLQHSQSSRDVSVCVTFASPLGLFEFCLCEHKSDQMENKTTFSAPHRERNPAFRYAQQTQTENPPKTLCYISGSGGIDFTTWSCIAWSAHQVLFMCWPGCTSLAR